MDLGDEAVAVLRRRYFAWIVTPGKGKDGKDVESPQQVWADEDGHRLQRQFERIGRQAAMKALDKNKRTVSEVETLEEAKVIESDSDCPWCRPPGG